ncbi:hypothetical protein BV006_01880B, partial [Haemophilus influenzae]
NAN